jgi:uncharacterized protein (DUF1697 family)
MGDFSAILASLGHQEVRTYIQSGNALFTSDRDDVTAMEREIEAEIGRVLGVETVAFIRSPDELERVVGGNPFGEDAPRLHVSFLSGQPSESDLARLDPAQFEPDAFALGERALYLIYPGGVHRSKLTNSVIERRLGVKATARNWNTVNRLLAMTGD